MPKEQFQWFEQEALTGELKTAFSLMTCNGCHSGATQTRFTHVEPRPVDEEARISTYLEEQLEVRKTYFQKFTKRKHPYVH